VKEELESLPPRVRQSGDVRIVLTGVGEKNAEQTLLRELSRSWRLVLTCGFAGGLNPKLQTGAVVYCADESFPLTSAFETAGALPVRFHCSTRVVITAKEKEALWRATGHDAVEMESRIIRAICHHRGIPSATVRVISDSAHEDLPLDFNQLFGEAQKLRYGKLLGAIAASPRSISGLLKLRQQTRHAARELGRVLESALLSGVQAGG